MDRTPDVQEALQLIGPITAEALNRGCACRSLEPDRLRRQLEAEPSLTGLAEVIARTRPHLFSATAVFLSPDQLERIGAVIGAVEELTALPAYRHRLLERAPPIAHLDPGPRGVFLGFDFHLTADGPRLIEINTNAGGALLNAALARAQTACCAQMATMVRPASELVTLDAALLAMFTEEWRRQRGDRSLRRIAIVDDEPAAQYLYPEFQLFERLFRRAGLAAAIADPAELNWHTGQLWHTGEPVDLVYNRLTDFYLDAPGHAALRAAFEAGAVVLTPHPHAHARYADKRNLVLLSDDAALAALGASAAVRATLAAGVPRTKAVTRATADALWARRRGLFFKPAAGYGSRAAYRGDKLTRRVWQEILAGDYVAQALALPSERLVHVEGSTADLKLDVRAYAYAGAIQLVAARLYSGQTTNFRTPGGGFAPVFVVPRHAAPPGAP